MVLAQVRLDRRDDIGCLLHDQALQAILIIQVRVEELFHGLVRQLALKASLVVLFFLGVNVMYDTLQLRKRHELERRVGVEMATLRRHRDRLRDRSIAALLTQVEATLVNDLG